MNSVELDIILDNDILYEKYLDKNIKYFKNENPRKSFCRGFLFVEIQRIACYLFPL